MKKVLLIARRIFYVAFLLAMSTCSCFADEDINLNEQVQSLQSESWRPPMVWNSLESPIFGGTNEPALNTHLSEKGNGTLSNRNNENALENVGSEASMSLRIVLGLTVLAILPALLMALTSFLRIIIVLSMLRHAIGMPETPPNPALIGIAIFLTMFVMAPTMQEVNVAAFEPYISSKIGHKEAYERASKPIRSFLIHQTREQDLALMIELSKAKVPNSIDEVSNVQLIPAFMLSELRAAFQIGFMIFLPFLLIDLVVSSVLMALGMMMMPPTSIALPLKILMFVLVDGWSLILKALVGSFH